ncbi:MAG: CmcI family methyltransferase, partial [Candidatus Bathyarchaeia archaeon]
MNLIKRGFRILREEGSTTFIKTSSSYVFRKVVLIIVDVGVGYGGAPFIARKLIKLVENTNDVQDAITLAFSFRYLYVSIKPNQIEYEIAKLLELVRNIKPNFILEIGTADGGSLFLFTRVAQPDATIISIDLPGGKFGGGYPKWKIPIYKAFAREGQRV